MHFINTEKPLYKIFIKSRFFQDTFDMHMGVKHTSLEDALATYCNV